MHQRHGETEKTTKCFESRLLTRTNWNYEPPSKRHGSFLASSVILRISCPASKVFARKPAELCVGWFAVTCRLSARAPRLLLWRRRKILRNVSNGHRPVPK